MRARRTYLEMRDPSMLVPAPAPARPVEVVQETSCSPGLYRHLYLGVGRDYYWTDRARWTDEEIAAHLGRPDIRVWVAWVDRKPAGYFELRSCDDRSIEIAYFGLLPEFIGLGLGGHLLTLAALQAWASRPTRVWLHTSSLDHPAALTNYQKRGFVPVRVEDYEVESRG